MKKMMTIVVLAAMLAGCGGAVEEPSTVSATVTRTAEPMPAPSVTESSPVPGAEAILEAAWEVQTQEDQYAMCFGWGYDRETMIDTFFAESGGSLNITRADVIEFFDGKCS